MRRPRETGKRKNYRIELRKPAFIVLEPNGCWYECEMLDISAGGVALEVGGLPVGKVFVLILTPNGKVRRTCLTAWRRGTLLGARFTGGKELRQLAGGAEVVA